MLTHLKLEDFKVWRSIKPIRLVPITLLLVTNFSGKSSLIQSLLLIRRTVKGDDPNLDLNLGNPDADDPVTLGQLKDVLCRHGADSESTSATQVGIEFREMIYEWLADFDQSDRRIALDQEGLLRDVYERNMPFNLHGQEYGMQVLQYKLDRNLSDHVPIDSLEANGEHIAVPDLAHEALVTDREDHKWVACALDAEIFFDHVPPIVYGAKTDWFMAEDELKGIGLCFQRLLPDGWYTARVCAG